MLRRDVLKFGAGALACGALGIGPAHATIAQSPKHISLVNLHTGDTFQGAFWENGAPVQDAVNAIVHVMRDHRSGDSHAIDPRLLDTLDLLRQRLETRAPFQIISGYRSPVSNAAMHAASSGVASRSLHMDGRAIDIRVRGVECAALRDASLALGRGGVGYYPSSDFVHVDTGRVRQWAGR